MPQNLDLDGSKYDIRLLCTGTADSDDAGLVEGVPIDPPDDTPGWVLKALWVEHDVLQEKGDKGTVVNRKVNPAHYQLWAKPKPKTKANLTKSKPKSGASDKEKPKRRRKGQQQTLPNVEGSEPQQPDAS